MAADETRVVLTTEEQEAASLVSRAELRGYERGRAEAVDVAHSKRSAAVSLRAEADACAAMATALGTAVPLAGKALTDCASILRAAATRLGG